MAIINVEPLFIIKDAAGESGNGPPVKVTFQKDYNLYGIGDFNGGGATAAVQWTIVDPSFNAWAPFKDLGTPIIFTEPDFYYAFKLDEIMYLRVVMAGAGGSVSVAIR